MSARTYTAREVVERERAAYVTGARDRMRTETQDVTADPFVCSDFGPVSLIDCSDFGPVSLIDRASTVAAVLYDAGEDGASDPLALVPRPPEEIDAATAREQARRDDAEPEEGR